jgi:hypothetical protein
MASRCRLGRQLDNTQLLILHSSRVRKKKEALTQQINGEAQAARGGRG